MARKQDNARYEAKQKAQGWVRGPRITGDAAEQLRRLAFQHRLTPAEVVSRLLLSIPLQSDVGVSQALPSSEEKRRAEFMAREGLSEPEMRHMERNGWRP